MTYLEFLALQRHATFVITDSGGIQEETTYLRIPCLTMRENTERPITVTIGTNQLIGCDTERLKAEARKILAGEGKAGRIPPLWDGKAAERIAQAPSVMLLRMAKDGRRVGGSSVLTDVSEVRAFMTPVRLREQTRYRS